MEDWDKECSLDNSCRMTKIFYPAIRKGKAKVLGGLTHDRSRRLIEIVKGQNNLHYIKNKIYDNNKLCRLCEEEEGTFDHFVHECPCIIHTRRDYFGLNKIVNAQLENRHFTKTI